MTRAQRTVHLITWMTLLFALPAVLALALFTRAHHADALLPSARGGASARARQRRNRRIQSAERTS